MKTLYRSGFRKMLICGITRNSRSRILPLVLLTAASAVLCAAQSNMQVSSEREAAVVRARDGDAQGALVILRRLLQQDPDNARLLADTTIIASWAGEDSYALELYGQLSTPKNDFDVISSAAHSARNLHLYDQAFDLYHRAAILRPDRWQALLGEAMVLTDKGDYKQADALIQPLLHDHMEDLEVESGAAYLCMRKNDFACVIDMDQRRIARMPQASAEIQNQMAEALARLGANTLAKTTYNGTDPQQILRLQADLGAEQVRWAEADRTWTARQTDAGQALVLLDQVIAATKPSDPIWKQAQSDRLLALANLNRAGDVVRSFEHLQQVKTDIPDYALLRVADAYLAIHNPERAEGLYRRLAGRMPHDPDLWSGLAYAQFEREHISSSFATIDRAWKDAPQLLQSKDLRVPQTNELNTAFGLQAAAMRGYADLSYEEQKMLSAMLAAAPANASLNHALAMTYLARGWPLLAGRQERIADSFEQPDELPTIEDAKILEQAGKRDCADALLGPLLRREGNNPPMIRYLRDRAIERGWQSDVHGGFEWSSSRFIGTNSQSSEAHLYSPLIDNRWRAYIHSSGDNGEFQGGGTWRSRGALGMSFDYARQGFWAEAGADQNPAEAKLGVAAGTNLWFGDHWNLSVKGDTDDLSQVQLITSLQNIRARSVNANLSWRQSDLSSVGAGFVRFLFTDGNQRTIISGSWDQRAWTAPHFLISISPQFWTSWNSRDENRVYFNPRRDASAGALATLRWITWRRYESNFAQQITVFGGPYWQENYGTGVAMNTSYMQNWAINRRFGAFGKVTWNSQPYDGSNDHYTDVTFGLTWGIQ